jgi:hypothetical protein
MRPVVKKWLKRIVVIIGAAAGLLVLAIAVILYGLSRPVEKKLGGHWIISQARSFTIESGVHPHRLERAHGWKRLIIARDAWPYFYIGNDCVLFGTFEREEDYLNAACGDRPPIVVAHAKKPANQSSSLDWRDLELAPGRFKAACDNPHEMFLPNMSVVEGKEISWNSSSS